jgi:hypothetical protein
MSMSAQNTVKLENTTLVQQAPSMLVHGIHPKVSSEQLGLIQALKISAACVLLVGLVYTTLGSKSSSHPSEGTSKMLASKVSTDSQKARETSYKQSRPLGSIFFDAMGNSVASSN